LRQHANRIGFHCHTQYQSSQAWPQYREAHREQRIYNPGLNYEEICGLERRVGAMLPAWSAC
jgi:hypothetical protein